MAREADELLGGIDILVNNAGITFPESALKTSVEHWETTMAVNLTAPMFISREIAPGMIARGGGKIIMICSNAGIVGLADHAAYCASKGGMVQLTKVLAIEWARHNVNVNAIAPTVILTPMGEQVWGRRRSATQCWRGSLLDASASRWKSRAPFCSWRAQRRTSCTVRRSWWMGATRLNEPSDNKRE